MKHNMMKHNIFSQESENENKYTHFCSYYMHTESSHALSHVEQSRNTLSFATSAKGVTYNA
jgi:hypothetical protein